MRCRCCCLSCQQDHKRFRMWWPGCPTSITFQMFWPLFTTNCGTLWMQIAFQILLPLFTTNYGTLWPQIASLWLIKCCNLYPQQIVVSFTPAQLSHNLVGLCFWCHSCGFIMQLDYILAIVDSGHHSLLWTKATTFLKSQRVYLLGPSGTVHCSQNIEQTHRSVNNASPGMATFSWHTYRDYFIMCLTLMWKCGPYNVLRILDNRSSKLFDPIGISAWTMFWGG